MPPSQGLRQRPISPQNSSTPLISKNQRQELGEDLAEDEVEIRDPQTGQRRIIRKENVASNKGEANSAMDSGAASGMLPQTHAAVNAMRPDSPSGQRDLKAKPLPIPISPARMQPSLASALSANSPGRMRSSSPRLHSPASSEIFERNVQEPVPPSSLSQEAHMPSHVLTEDHIPPVLEASVEAITSEDLNPDEVEIVTTASHQPATATLEASTSHLDLASLHSLPTKPPILTKQPSEGSSIANSATHVPGVIPSQSSLLSSSLGDDAGSSNYAHLDPNDPRRLSFISFADVVQDEHQQSALSATNSPHPLSQQTNFDTGTHPADFSSLPRPNPSGHAHTASTTALAGSAPGSPGSTSFPASPAITTPPARTASPHSVRSFGSASAKGAASPGQLGAGSGLAIETMRQAVRKTASGDLRHPSGTMGGQGAGLSPVGSEEGVSGVGSLRGMGVRGRVDS